MQFKPNEIYGRVIEIGALARSDLDLEQFLSALGSRLDRVRTPMVSASEFLDHLAASANLGPQYLMGSMPPPGEHAPAVPSDRAQTLELIDRQVSDLRAMAQAGQLHDRQRYIGLTAPSGQRWDNVDVGSYLEGAAAATFHTLDPEGDEIEMLSWATIHSFLQKGQIYE